MRFLSAILMLAVLGGCGPIDPPPPTDEDGEVIPQPPPFDTWLTVAGVTPGGGEISPRPTLGIEFDTWIDDDVLLDFRVAQLQSAGLAYGGRVKWRMTTKTLEFTPFSELETGLRYRLTFNADTLESVTGSPFRASELPQFVVSEEGATFVPEQEPDVLWEDVDEIFESNCRSCHSDPQWDLNPLTRNSLVGAKSDQVDRILVLPFDPTDSYLMHKIIPGYPVRKFTVQPPPWSELPPLDEADQFLIEQWIAHGAR